MDAVNYSLHVVFRAACILEQREKKWVALFHETERNRTKPNETRRNLTKPDETERLLSSNVLQKCIK